MPLSPLSIAKPQTHQTFKQKRFTSPQFSKSSSPQKNSLHPAPPHWKCRLLQIIASLNLAITGGCHRFKEDPTTPPSAQANQSTSIIHVVSLQRDRPNNRRLIQLTLPRAVHLSTDELNAYVSQIRLSSPIVDPQTEETRWFNLPFLPGSIRIQDNQLILQAENVVSQGSRLTLPTGLTRRLGLEQSQFTLEDGIPANIAARGWGALVPTNYNLFTTYAYPNAVPMQPAADPHWTAEQWINQTRASLAADMHRIYPNQPQQVQRLLDLYDGTGEEGKILKEGIPNCNLRAGLLYLAKTSGEHTISQLIQDLRQHRYTDISFANLSDDLIAEVTTNDNGQQSIHFNQRYQFEAASRWPSLFVHELGHNDRLVSAPEEVSLTTLQARTYMQLVRLHPRIISTGLTTIPTELERRLNTMVLLYINSGEQGFPYSGNEVAEGVDQACPDSNYTGSLAEVYSRDLSRSQLNLQADTPTNPFTVKMAQQYRPTAHLPRTITFQELSEALDQGSPSLAEDFTPVTHRLQLALPSRLLQQTVTTQ